MVIILSSDQNFTASIHSQLCRDWPLVSVLLSVSSLDRVETSKPIYCQVISLIGIFWNFSAHFVCFVVVGLCFSGLFEVWLHLALWNNQNFSFDWYQFCWYFFGRYCVWSTLLLKKKNKNNVHCKVQHWQKEIVLNESLCKLTTSNSFKWLNRFKAQLWFLFFSV
jgi:hypothetical protein